MSAMAVDPETSLMNIRTLILVMATVASGLSAGLFYSYFFSVMRGLAATDDRTFVSAMQAINVKIINGWFAAVFVGAPLLTVVSAILLWISGSGSARNWVLAAIVLWALTIIITMAANVPLNNALIAAGEPDRIADLGEVRRQFETAWVRWNTLRTVTSVAAFGSIVLALVADSRSS
jgi:uncharacterized membrane protein